MSRVERMVWAAGCAALVFAGGWAPPPSSAPPSAPAGTAPSDGRPPLPPAPQDGPVQTVPFEVKVLPPVQVPPAPARKAGAPVTTADDLLVDLETAGQSLRTFQADLRKTRQYSELEGGGGEDKDINDGKLMFMSEPAEKTAGAPGASPAPAKMRRRFQVDFVSKIVDNVRQPDARTFIFDGTWFVERNPTSKQIFKRQIVPPGQTIDPLAIGEGPFPIPIGQRREQILQRFTAELLPADQFPDAGPLPEALKDTYQLKLVPRTGSDEAKKFQEVRIWYRKGDLLPRVARTVDRDDSKTIVTLTNMTINQPLPTGAFDTATPQGWDEQVTAYPSR